MILPFYPYIMPNITSLWGNDVQNGTSPPVTSTINNVSSAVSMGSLAVLGVVGYLALNKFIK